MSDTKTSTTNSEPRYNQPPEGPSDITPADEVYIKGETIVIDHGPGQQSEFDKEEFYDENTTPSPL